MTSAVTEPSILLMPVPPMGSPQWYGSPVSSATETTANTTRRSTPKQPQSTLAPVGEITPSRSGPGAGNTLGLVTPTTNDKSTRDADTFATAARPPLTELSKSDINTRSPRLKLKSKGLPSYASPTMSRLVKHKFHQTVAPKNPPHTYVDTASL